MTLNKNKLINKSDSIFIAGHNGMVGKSLHKLFLKKGYKNICIVNRFSLDLRNEVEVSNWFAKNKPDIVIIAAAKVGGILANKNYPVEFLLDNLKIQNNIIENAWKQKVKRLLFLGSSCIYPKFSKQPIKEEYLLSDSLEETNENYAIAKIAGIKLCNALRNEYNFDSFSLLPCNLYGPGDNYDLSNSHVIPALINKFYQAKVNKKKKVFCWGDGTPKREFMHVEDLAEACIFSLETFNPKGTNGFLDDNGKILNYLNVGTGKEISILELANKISNIIEYDGDIIWEIDKPNGTPLKKLDITRINKLGWKYTISLDNGLKSTINDFNKLMKIKN